MAASFRFQRYHNHTREWQGMSISVINVTLDDALTATDIGRLTRVKGVLEEGLQVLILSCHPERYRGLVGANFVDLEGIVRSAS